VPELPDIVAYVEAIRARVEGERLERVSVANPFLLRSVDPPLESTFGRTLSGVRRIGKRIVIELDDVALVIHLMIAGRLHWNTKRGIATLEFSNGELVLTEAGTKRRASLHVTRDPDALNPGGLEPLDATRGQFAGALRREVHTVKRALTDPRIFSGIGNAYSDEILHRAKLSPLRRTDQMTDDEIARLHEATQSVLQEWIDRLRGPDFPEGVTAFRPEFAVHGKYRQPCPVCGAPVQRIRYAENETNYCARCQTGGRVLADRSLSRFLKEDWPRSIEELEGPA
jgi:formamidopyrimidine-DNA glycosylase